MEDVVDLADEGEAVEEGGEKRKAPAEIGSTTWFGERVRALKAAAVKNEIVRDADELVVKLRKATDGALRLCPGVTMTKNKSKQLVGCLVCLAVITGNAAHAQRHLRKHPAESAKLSDSAKKTKRQRTETSFVPRPTTDIVQLLSKSKRLDGQSHRNLAYDLAVCFGMLGLPANKVQSPAFQVMVNSIFTAARVQRAPQMPGHTTLYKYMAKVAADARAQITAKWRGLIDAGVAYSVASDVLTVRNASFNCVIISGVDPSTFALHTEVLDIMPVDDHTADTVGEAIVDAIKVIDPRCAHVVASTTDSASSALAASRKVTETTLGCMSHHLANAMKQVTSVPALDKAIKNMSGTIRMVLKSSKRMDKYRSAVKAAREEEEKEGSDNQPAVPLLGEPSDDVEQDGDAPAVDVLEDLAEADDEEQEQLEEGDGEGPQQPGAAISSQSADANAAIARERYRHPKTPAKVRFAYMETMCASALANFDSINRAITAVKASRQRAAPAGGRENEAARYSEAVKVITEEDRELARGMVELFQPLKKAIRKMEGFVPAGEALYHFRVAAEAIRGFSFESEAVQLAQQRVLKYMDEGEYGTTMRRARRGVPSTTIFAPDVSLLSAALDPRIMLATVDGVIAAHEHERIVGRADGGEELGLLGEAMLKVRRDMLRCARKQASGASSAAAAQSYAASESTLMQALYGNPEWLKMQSTLIKMQERTNPNPSVLASCKSIMEEIEKNTKAMIRFDAGDDVDDDDDDAGVVVEVFAEIDRYLELLRNPHHIMRGTMYARDCPDADVSLESALRWWKEHSAKLPLLARTAAKFLPVLGAASGVESTWSMFGALSTALRASASSQRSCDNCLLYVRRDIMMRLLKYKR